MTKKEMQILIAIIHLVVKRYQKDHDVQLICNALEKILVRAEEKKRKKQEPITPEIE